jgi:hypothetical protein
MLKQIPIWFLFWLLPVVCHPDVAVAADVTQHIEGEIAGFNVVIDFEGLPQPLKPARAIVTLTSKGDAESTHFITDAPGDLEFGFYRQQIEWIGERKVFIDGPRKAGDVHSIPIEFMLLQSRGEIMINWAHAMGTPGIAIVWCIDADGSVVALGRNSGPCNSVVQTVFFDRDSIRILTPGPRNPIALADAYYTVVPPFRIGDTSTVCFHLTALQDFPKGFDMELVYGHMSVLGVPEAVKGPISKGQALDFCLQVVPLAFRDRHEISIYMKRPEELSRELRRSEYFQVSAYFKDDGSLMYVHSEDQMLPEEKLSKGLPAGTEATCGRIIISRNPDVTE